MSHRASWGHVRKLPSGRYQASYVAPNGSRVNGPMTFPAKRDAEAWLAVQRSRIVEGEWSASTPTAKHDRQADRSETLATFGERWIENRLTSRGLPLRESTKQGYRQQLRADLSPLAAMPLDGISSATVEAWYRERVRAGKVTSASKGYAMLKTMLKDAVKSGLIAENPCDVPGAASARTGRDVEPPTAAELAIIIANTPRQFQALVVLAAWSALRFGEQTELRRKDIVDDGEQIVVRVRRGVTYIRRVGFVVGAPKTSRSKRDVVLPMSASSMLRSHLVEWVPDEPDALVFPGAHGGHLNQGGKDRWWHKARAAAGRPDLPWHGLRHYGLTQYAKAGATLAELMARAGHSTTQAAMVYQHATGRDAELARKMDVP